MFQSLSPLATALVAALTFAPLTAAADPTTPLDAEGFDANVTGQTVTYDFQGQYYGIEEYLPDRRVRWADAGGECQYGRWYQEGRFICFVYEYNNVPQCWTFFDTGRGLRALFNDTPGDTELFERGRSDRPLVCSGPDVGV